MEKQTLRTSAFMAITFSTVAITACLVTFPLLFTYVQRMEANAQLEIDWCYKRSRDMWRDMVVVRSGRPTFSDAIVAHKEAAHRQTRGAANAAEFFATRYRDQTYNEFPDAGVQAFGASCCTCQRGPPGPPGPPGGDGTDGAPGNAGDIGPPGDAVPASDDYIKKFPDQCPCEAPKGPNGTPGQKGQPGNPGAPGNPGGPGTQGGPGEPGDAGQPGPPGGPGNNGGPGTPGETTPGSGGPEGTPGKPGPKGPAGPPGENGGPGKNGDNGGPGPNGDKGFPGSPGQPGGPGTPGAPGDAGPSGACDHCPPARLAPGY